MKLHLPSTKAFLEALEIAAHATSTQMPILSCVLVEIRRDGEVCLTGDGLDSRISCSFSGAEVDEPFAFVASPKMLRASLRADTATIEFKDNRLAIESGGKSSLVTLPVSEFPRARKEITVKAVESGHFLGALKMVSNCANQSSDTLDNCAAWDAKSSHLFSLGAGRSSVCIHTLDLDIGQNFCLPVPHTKVIAQCFDADDDFAIGLEENLLCIKERNISAWFSLIEVKMPNHTVLIQDGPVVATVGREAFLSALDALELFSDDIGHWCELKSTDGKWTASAINVHGTSAVPIEEVEENKPLETFVASRHAMAKFLRGLEHDRVALRQTPSGVMLTGDGSSGTMGIFNLRRL